MSNRFFTRTLIVGVVGLAAVSLGCDKLPSAPVAPSSPSVPTTVDSISPATGLAGDAVKVSGAGFAPGAKVKLDGIAAIVTSMTSALIVVRTPTHAAGKVDVVVTNPGGQTATVTEGYTYQAVTITATPNLATAGDRLTVSWVAPEGRGCDGGGDWIALLKVSDPDTARGPFTHLCGATSGTAGLSAPAEPGEYDFRYMVEGGAVARSNPVTVTTAASQ